MNNSSGTATATLGGTLLTIAVHINSHDVLKTIVLAALGAVVSFLMSLLMKRILGRKVR